MLGAVLRQGLAVPKVEFVKIPPTISGPTLMNPALLHQIERKFLTPLLTPPILAPCNPFKNTVKFFEN